MMPQDKPFEGLPNNVWAALFFYFYTYKGIVVTKGSKRLQRAF
ncbi:MAG: hypothetical protein SPE75_09905 [Prevotella sp.]|nr:hypothetical protein [Prevotella sp.]